MDFRCIWAVQGLFTLQTDLPHNYSVFSLFSVLNFVHNTCRTHTNHTLTLLFLLDWSAFPAFFKYVLLLGAEMLSPWLSQPVPSVPKIITERVFNHTASVAMKLVMKPRPLETPCPKMKYSNQATKAIQVWHEDTGLSSRHLHVWASPLSTKKLEKIYVWQQNDLERSEVWRVNTMMETYFFLFPPPSMSLW